jgi:hypothetical protein
MPRLRIAQAVLALAAAVALSIGAAQPSFAGTRIWHASVVAGSRGFSAIRPPTTTDVW